MALDPDQLIAEAVAHEKAAKELRQAASSLRKLRRATEGIVEGQPAFRPVGWKTADDLKILMEDGKREFTRGELEREMVERKIAGEAGSDENVRLRAARTTITSGKAKGYLVEIEHKSGNPDKNTIRWIPGIWSNPRLRKQ